MSVEQKSLYIFRFEGVRCEMWHINLRMPPFSYTAAGGVASRSSARLTFVIEHVMLHASGLGGHAVTGSPGGALRSAARSFSKAHFDVRSFLNGQIPYLISLTGVSTMNVITRPRGGGGC